MKKLILITIFFVLVGCSVDTKVSSKQSLAIKPTNLTEYHKNLIQSAGTEDAFLFDIVVDDIDTDQLYLHSWVDHYINGEKQEAIGQMATTLEEPEVTVTFSNLLMEVEEGVYERLDVSFVTESGISSAHSKPQKVLKQPLGKATTSIGEEIKLTKDQPFIAAMVVKSSGNSIGLSIDALNENDEEVDQYVNKYEEVYLYQVMVSKKHP